jgi:hypothetical protein
MINPETTHDLSISELHRAEASLLRYTQNQEHNSDLLRHHVKLAILEAVNGITAAKTSLAEAIRFASDCTSQSHRRRAAAILIRSLEISDLIRSEDQRVAAQFLETALPDLMKDLSIDPQAQTFKKWEAWIAVHGRITSNLSQLSDIRGSLKEIFVRRADVMKLMATRSARPYAAIYQWDQATAELRMLFESMQPILTCTDQQFVTRHDELIQRLSQIERLAKSNPTFLFIHYVSPLVATIRLALSDTFRDRRERMIATIRIPVRDEGFLGKAYPLYDISREIHILVPLTNDGPGTALRVEFEVRPDKETVLGPDILSVGDIPPGPFAASLPILLAEPATNIGVLLIVRWTVEGSEEQFSTRCHFFVESQRADINWASLEALEPYSTAVAEGDQFVGRKVKLHSIAGRLTRDRMLSTYITGQKRIGKTSLALAIRDYVLVHDNDDRYRFLDLEWGAFAGSDPNDTVQALGEEVASFLCREMPGEPRPERSAFSGTLAPLVSLSKRLQRLSPHIRCVVILDEFDEIHPEMYRFGRLAEAVFSNLRSLSAQKNIAFILVGGEKMPYVMGAQGDQLNQFVREGLDYFSRAEEWDDLRSLICKPVDGLLTWRDGAINELFTQASGHPYYTKLLCAQVFRDAVLSRDADITQAEVLRSLTRLIGSLDVNAFAHYWKDGIQADEDQAEAIALSRSRLLVCAGRVLRDGKRLCLDTISREAPLVGLISHEIQPLLNEMCRRGIMDQDADNYQVKIPLFELWLKEVGASRIIVDTLGDELAAQRYAGEAKAYVQGAEVVDVVSKWTSYRGRQIGTDDVRRWLGQVQSNEQQRYLFKILQHVRFVSELEIREKLRVAASLMVSQIPEYVRTSKADRRKDILVTYIDGAGKSGSYYASRFAEENFINAKAVLSPDDFVSAAEAYESATDVSINAVVIVDDLIGTGKGISENLGTFLSRTRTFLQQRTAFLGIVSLFATKDGEARVRREIKHSSSVRCDLRVCEMVGSDLQAFPDSGDDLGFWTSAEERDKAKALCVDLGARIYKKEPLGFGGKGLLLVFPNTVPNNSVPILHSDSRSNPEWKPLFERPVN